MAVLSTTVAPVCLVDAALRKTPYNAITIQGPSVYPLAPEFNAWDDLQKTRI